MAHVFIRGDTEKPVLGDFSPIGRHEESNAVKQALGSGTWNSFGSFAALVFFFRGTGYSVVSISPCRF
jgi:hypothetical protein